MTPGKAGYVETVLHAFAGYPDDGAAPLGELLRTNGVLYGTTSQGGVHKRFQPGVAYSLSPEASGYAASVLYDFKSGRDGKNPTGTLIADRSGSLYGTTADGGGFCDTQALNCGTVFRLKPSGSGFGESVLYRFRGYADAGDPEAGLLLGQHGELFGTSWAGGSVSGGWGYGAVFEVLP